MSDYYIVRSGTLQDVVVEASGLMPAMMKAILKHRPKLLASEIYVRPAGVFAGAPEETMFSTQAVLSETATRKWYNETEDGNLVYAGAPLAWQ